MNIDGIDYEEVGLYLALNKTEEELRNLRVSEFCPKKKDKGPKPKITSCGSKLKRSERFACWNPSDKNASNADPDTKRKMITEALRIVIKFIMKNHVYEFDNKIHKQNKGGAIGVELTGDLTKVFMVWWTKQFLSKMSDQEIGIFIQDIRR